MSDKLVVPEATVREALREQELKQGQWYWVKEKDGEWLGCVTHIGSNYAEITSAYGGYSRIPFDGWDDHIARIEPNAGLVINQKVTEHQANVRSLLNEVRRVTASLGLTPVASLPAAEAVSTALVAVHGRHDVDEHKKALVLAKEKTLPDLFKQIEKEHEALAHWMKAQLLPMKAELKTMKNTTEGIEDKIFTVELYAGLCEELTLVRKGEPAGPDHKIHLFQRRHYMDEECLANYQAGGMSFDDIKVFDRWLAKRENFDRILPYPKCAVAFRVRRDHREPDYVSLQEFIRMGLSVDQDKKTFLYMRNGDRCYRLDTEIDFGPELFPDPSRSPLVSGQLYVDSSWHKSITEPEYRDLMERKKRDEEKYETDLAAWEKLPKEEREKKPKPWYPHYYNSYEPLTPKHLYYDDVMETLNKEATAYNRIAIVLQGLLDRSPAFHPHPPWRLWTPDGFNSGVVLAYDGSKGLTDGPEPDFETYRVRLNASITRGTHTAGQEEAWLRYEAERENERQKNDWRLRDRTHYNRFRPYGNPGPGVVAVVQRVSRDKSRCWFSWGRERARRKWVPNPERPGWMKRDDSAVASRFSCETDRLLNVDAYTPGDYRQFYRDPRTRAKYLVWAPLLLAAEDFKAKEEGCTSS
jgi:hypothetical protein